MSEAIKFVTDAHPGFIKLSDVYRLAADKPAERLWGIPSNWFSEISGVVSDCDFDVITAEQRFVQRAAYYQSHDGVRYTDISTLWFDGKPFAIVGSAGRSGRDKRYQYITDPATRHEAILYLLGKVRVDDSDSEVYAPDYELPAEEIFDFYSGGVASNLGVEVATPRRDLFEYVGGHNEDFLQPILGREEVVIAVRGVEPAALLRSGDSYYARGRRLTDEDLDKVSHLRDFIAHFTPHASGTGETTGYIYERCRERPSTYREAIPL